MKNALWLSMIIVVGAFAGHADAVYKCTTARGVVYQDRPCREGTESDVPIVIPTGELAPTAASPQDERTPGNAARPENRSSTSKQGRSADDSAAASKSTEGRATNDSSPGAGEATRKRDSRVAIERSVPMTAEDARRADPTAKYYTTDAVAAGAETPEHMTCESPSGEKRRFILTNGQLTSI